MKTTEEFELKKPRLELNYQEVCQYCVFTSPLNNFVIEKKTNEMNIIAAEIKPEIKLGEVYYFKELNCNNIDLSWDYERVISNLNTISVMSYQELTTDIKGNPN